MSKNSVCDSLGFQAKLVSLDEILCSGMLIETFGHTTNYFLLLIAIPINNMIVPITKIWTPYETQSGLEYMNEDSGPTIDWP